MAQTPAVFYSNDERIDYTPVAVLAAGDVINIGGIAMINTTDYPAADLAAAKVHSLARVGVFKVPKITGAMTVGLRIYWDPAGSPIGGTAASGAATTVSVATLSLGIVAAAAASGDATVKVVLL